jgi:chemotaxis protein MotA
MPGAHQTGSSNFKARRDLLIVITPTYQFRGFIFWMASFLQNCYLRLANLKKEMLMILQVVFSLLLVIVIFALAFSLDVGRMGLGSNLNALMIVLGGTLSASLIAYPWRRLLWTARLLKKAFTSRTEIEWTIDTLLKMTRAYRKDGIRALERMGKKIPDGLLKDAVELMTCNYSKEKIEHILAKEVQITTSQYETGEKILYTMARLAPALGLTGTIVNLIHVFRHISDSQSLVGYMAVALLSTFYGVVLGNLCFIPLSNKLRDFMDQEQIRLELIQEGILDVYDAQNPTAVERKLEALSTTDIKPSGIPSRARIFVGPPQKDTPSVYL